MACLIVPATVGIATTLLRKRFPERWHINWFNMMAFGATVALGADHIANGEIVPWPPFLTAMATPEGTAAMIGELLAIGVPMTLALALAWAVMVIAYESVLAQKTAALKG